MWPFMATITSIYSRPLDRCLVLGGVRRWVRSHAASTGQAVSHPVDYSGINQPAHGAGAERR